MDLIPLTDLVFHSRIFTEIKHWDDSVQPRETVHISG